MPCVKVAISLTLPCTSIYTESQENNVLASWRMLALSLCWVALICYIYLGGGGMGIVTRIIQQFPGIDRLLIEELVRLGYTEDEIKDILNALGLNASTAGYRPADVGWIPYINRALTAILQRFTHVLNNEQYDPLLNAGYTQNEIRNMLFANLLPATQFLIRIGDAYASNEYDRLHRLGYTDVEIRSLIRAGFTVSQLRLLADRVNDAERNGTDAQGLTVEQINDLLFKDRPINEKDTLGIVRALLSGIESKAREGEVARCIIDCVTLFDVPYGLGGAQGQLDVGTRHLIIEAKVDSVAGGKNTYKQIKRDINNDVMNPPDANGIRKSVILYAPGYDKAAAASITDHPPKGLGAHIVKSCEELRKQIRQLGGP